MARVVVWNEFRHERSNPAVAAIYPHGIHEAIAAPLRQQGHEVATATLDEPEHGLTADRLAAPTEQDVHIVVLAAGRLGKARLIDNIQCTAPRRG